MSDDFAGFAPPPFKPEDALTQLKRQLRDLKLTERGSGFDQRGKRVAELQVDGAGIAARTARKLAITPEWDRQTIASANDQRKWVDELKKRLARWDREE
jgi:ribosomal protein L13E